MKKITIRIARQLIIIAGASMLAACDRPTPQQIRANLHLPDKKITRDIGAGKSIYQRQCISCHGVDAGGTGIGPPLVHRTYRPSHHPDTAFHLAVKNGVKQHHWHFGHMPPVEAISPEQMEHVIGYVRAEQRRAGIR